MFSNTGSLAVLLHSSFCFCPPSSPPPFPPLIPSLPLSPCFYPSFSSLIFRFTYISFPFLPVGPVTVHLSSPLSLEEIRSRNPLVYPGGHYQPPDCRPRHHTAIVVPYRNRQNHLRALLYHLHPFLQRQQIHYSIYIVQQVRQQLFFSFCCFSSISRNPLEQTLTHTDCQRASSLPTFSAARRIQAFWSSARQAVSFYLVLG